MKKRKLKSMQKKEAIKRMKMLNLFTTAIEEFSSENVINKSEYGILYWLSEEEKQIVKKFEKEYNAVVYHVIFSDTNFGKLLNIMYVSEHYEEWESDEQDIKEGYAVVYVKNLSDDICSEFGSIGVKNLYGGLIRMC